MNNSKVKQCDTCASTLIKKTSGHESYYECSYCGKKEEK